MRSLAGQRKALACGYGLKGRVMQELFTARSTNGRWAVAIVSEQPVADTFKPIAGRLVPLGEKSGVTSFRLDDGQAGEFVVIAADAKARVGAVVIASVDLQSSRSVTLLHVREGGVWEEFGYKRRSSHLYAIAEGQRVELSPALALALGLVTPDQPVVEEVPKTPTVESAFAAALKAALNKE
jgi:hypothetical protein